MAGDRELDEVASLLAQHRQGVPGASDRLVAMILDDLRAMARRRIEQGRMRGNVLVQPTGLAIDTILRILDQQQAIHDRQHLMALAARFMNWLLIDAARRDDRELPVTPMLDDSAQHPATEPDLAQLATVREAIRELESFSPSAAQVLALRGLSGCSIEDTAAALGVGHATVERRWRTAREWLQQRLRDGSTA